MQQKLLSYKSQSQGVVGPGNLIFNMLSCWVLCTLEFENGLKSHFSLKAWLWPNSILVIISLNYLLNLDHFFVFIVSHACTHLSVPTATAKFSVLVYYFSITAASLQIPIFPSSPVFNCCLGSYSIRFLSCLVLKIL